jgi:cation diffusion facilitator family transporter
MHTENLAPWQHSHRFTVDRTQSQRKTAIVVVITLITMIVEIVAGWLFGSMALLADGWHMGTHAAALTISVAAYAIARRHASDHRYAFGTWKVEVLGAYTSAIVLGIVGLCMVWASVQRLLHPVHIQYGHALAVAVVGLVVNAVCALVLQGGGHSHHGHSHGHEHAHESEHAHDEHGHGDLNLRSAYLHVLADALTSVLAIGALLGARYANAVWLDPAMGLLGAALVTRWSVLLLRDTSAVLLDREMNTPVADEVRHALEDADTRISDMHLWRVAEDRYACIVTLVAAQPQSVDEYKARLKPVHELAHVTVEILRCEECAPKAADAHTHPHPHPHPHGHDHPHPH